MQHDSCNRLLHIHLSRGSQHFSRRSSIRVQFYGLHFFETVRTGSRSAQKERRESSGDEDFNPWYKCLCKMLR